MHSVNNINSLTEDIKEIFTIPHFLIVLCWYFLWSVLGTIYNILITKKKPKNCRSFRVHYWNHLQKNSSYALKPVQIFCSSKKHSLQLQMLLLVYLPELVICESLGHLIHHRVATVTWNIINVTNKLSRISFIQKLYLFWDCNSDFLCLVIQALSRSNLPRLKNRHGMFLSSS